MGWMPRRLMLLLASSALLLAPLLTVQLATGAGRAHACSCAAPPPPLEALERADAVFLGRVVSFGTWSFEVDTGRGYKRPYSSVEFEVDRVWKGSVTTTTFAYRTYGSACGYPWFEAGEDFLVYAHEWRGVATVSQCSRTTSLENAEEDLRVLGEGQAPEPGVTGADPLRSPPDFLHSPAWWAPLLAGIAAAALIIRRWAGRREPK